MSKSIPTQLLAPGLVLLAALIVVLSFSPIALSWKVIDLSDIIVVFGTLFLISAILERGLEVYAAAARGNGRRDCQAAVNERRAAISEAEVATDTQLLQLQAKERGYRQQTQRVILALSLTMSTAIAIMGLRILARLVEPDSLQSTELWQQQLFHIVDIVLTAGVLAGGSEGVHKITSLYSDWTHRQRQLAKGNPMP